MRRQTSPQPGAQLDLFHPFPKTPQWTHLPQQLRQQTHRRHCHVADMVG
jgi:chlorite dismutase